RSDFAATLAGLNLVRGEWRGACVEAGGLRVFGEVAPPGPAPGERAIALFRPSSVAVFTSPPGGSLRNVLPVTVETLQTQGDRVRVSGGGLHADITPAAVADLGLRPGDEVYFAAKATEVSIHRG
ncbi:MAG: TOBE domain-containing protein, partial [Nocardioides sp.]